MNLHTSNCLTANLSDRWHSFIHFVASANLLELVRLNEELRLWHARGRTSSQGRAWLLASDFPHTEETDLFLEFCLEIRRERRVYHDLLAISIPTPIDAGMMCLVALHKKQNPNRSREARLKGRGHGTQEWQVHLGSKNKYICIYTHIYIYIYIYTYMCVCA